MRQTVGILGTPVDVLDNKAVIERLEQFIQERRFHQVATANTDFLINALEDPELRHILRHADLVVPDGMPLIWAARLMRSPLPERVTGADIVPALAVVAAQKGYKIFMLGARPDIARQAKERLEQQNPGLQIVGCLSPPVNSLLEMDNTAILDEIRRAAPDILLVAFGNPKQEKWIHLHRQQLQDVPICIGVGGTFDFIAGHTTRAPLWMQRSGCEWVYRLGQEPKRLWRRYTRDMKHFTRYILQQWRVMRSDGNESPADVYSYQVSDCTIISVIGNLNAESIGRFEREAAVAIESRTNIVLDMQNVISMDGCALGMLLTLPKRAAYYNLEMRLVSVNESIKRILEGSQMQDGDFRIAPSLAQAFRVRRSTGLYWRVRCTGKTARVEVMGTADNPTIDKLEQVCRRLLAEEMCIDLDMRGVTYADTALAAAVLRLAGQSRLELPVRLDPGSPLRSVLGREKALEKCHVTTLPELSPDQFEKTNEHDELPDLYPSENASYRTRL